MIALHREWSRGIHPVNTGRVQWLTDGFYQVMRELDAAVSEQQAAEAERIAAKRRG